jgi:serine phosphatase RsbU (regulator of sigma subunit)
MNITNNQALSQQQNNEVSLLRAIIESLTLQRNRSNDVLAEIQARFTLLNSDHERLHKENERLRQVLNAKADGAVAQNGKPAAKSPPSYEIYDACEGIADEKKL